MSRVERVVPATPAEVFAVLADGWTYSDPLRWALSRANDVYLHFRNQEALRRLGDLAVGRRLAVPGR
jgi:hypothetical protein